MPRAGQIIPEYTVPHVQTYINDNSIFTEVTDVTAADDSVRLLCVFASGKGEDNVIKKVTSLNQYLEEYGNPNFNLYGQPGYMPYTALLSGYASCYCMRVMPETALYSNVVISALGKSEVVQDPTTGADVTQFTVRFVAEQIVDFSDKDSLLLQIENLETDTPNAEGFIKYPFIAFSSKGRGVYGNNFRVRIVPETSLNDENNFVNYVFQILESENGVLLTKETFTGSLDDDAIVGNSSLLIDDAFNDPSTGSGKVVVATKASNLRALYEAYKTAIESSGTVTVSEFNNSDMLRGMTKDGSNMEGYVIDSVSVPFDSTTGIAFTGGSDSTLAPNYVPVQPDTATRTDVLNTLYVSAFSGTLDTAINSKRRTPCELILDAGYSENVKSAMVALATKRMDARLILDAGIISSLTAARAWATSPVIQAIDSFVIDKECSHLKIRDPFTGKVVPMTYTYVLANALPRHYRTVGNQIPFVGEDYTLITGHIPNSVRPAIDADDLETKEFLYRNKVNFLECIAEDRYIHGVQNTSQHVSSDLSEGNNVAVLLDMKRELETFVSKKLYNFAEPEDRKRFTEDADELLRPYNVTKVRSFEVHFDMNAFEEERSILHCYLAVVFKTMAKRGIIEIDINKRV